MYKFHEIIQLCGLLLLSLYFQNVINCLSLNFFVANTRKRERETKTGLIEIIFLRLLKHCTSTFFDHINWHIIAIGIYFYVKQPARIDKPTLFHNFGQWKISHRFTLKCDNLFIFIATCSFAFPSTNHFLRWRIPSLARI